MHFGDFSVGSPNVRHAINTSVDSPYSTISYRAVVGSSSDPCMREFAFTWVRGSRSSEVKAAYYPSPCSTHERRLKVEKQPLPLTTPEASSSHAKAELLVDMTDISEDAGIVNCCCGAPNDHCCMVKCGSCSCWTHSSYVSFIVKCVSLGNVSSDTFLQWYLFPEQISLGSEFSPCGNISGACLIFKAYTCSYDL